MEITYSTINSLDETGIIGGNTYTLTFTVLDVNGASILDLFSTYEFVMSYYDQPNYEVLRKSMTVSGDDVSVTLTPSDTLSLSGKFAYQIVLQYYDTKLYIPFQGVFTIIKALTP